MKKYKIKGLISGFINVGEFEASSKEAAKEIGFKKLNLKLCNCCSRKINNFNVKELEIELIEK